MSVLVVGLSHRTTSVETLERVALGDEAVTKLLDEVPESDHLSEAVAVATCNRVELYADAATFHGGVDEATALLSRHAGVDLTALVDDLHVFYDERAVEHLFKVAAGLDSMVVGESQILGQVRDAFRLAQTSGTTGRVLTEAFQTALRVGKRVRAETGIDAASRSLVSVGLGTLAPGGVAGSTVVVVGAGSMAGLATATLARGGAEVLVANRTHDGAVRLAESVGGTAVSMSEVPAALATADLLVTCTGASGIVIDAEQVERARPLDVLDLALPRDVDPGVRELAGVRLVDLVALASGGSAPGAADVDAARGIVAEELAGFAAARRHAQVAPTVVALRSMADDVVEAELTRMHGRLPDLDERARFEVAATVRRVVDKLLHEPTVRVKELAAGPGGADYEAALRKLFALDPKTVEAVTSPADQASSVRHADDRRRVEQNLHDRREGGGA